MQYRQDAKLNSNTKKVSQAKGAQVQQIVFDKEITQKWKVDTDEPTEILPYGLKKIQLSRLCDFWHQIKFFYHQNYHQLHHPQPLATIASPQVEEIQSYSSVQILHSAQAIENCKKISKVIWKIMRHRILKSFNKIRESAGMEQEESIELEDDKLMSYMIFLKLQQNSRIDLAIQSCDSVVDKNMRKKLLDAFLNMKQHYKSTIRRQIYRDKIKLECFSEIIMRNIKKLNIDLFVDSFTYLFQFSQSLKREQQYIESQSTKKQSHLSNGHGFRSQTNNGHFRSISNQKVFINDEDNSQEIYKRDTVTKNQYKNHHQIISNQSRQNQNQISTVKRENPFEKQILQNSNINSISSEYVSNIKSSHQKIIHSHYYYEDEDRHYSDGKEFQGNLIYQRETIINDNMNSLPTRREALSNKKYKQKNHYLISGVQNNISSQTLQPPQKTVRTPSRSDVNKKSLLSHQSQYQHQQGFKPNNSYRHQDVHIPITQRVDRHYHEDNYKQVLQEEVSDRQEQSHQNIHQQICVIRNFSTTPTRKPDRYQKIPILSSNIEFRQFFLNSKDKKSHQKFSSHSSSFYEKKICSQCQYCSKLAKIKQMVQHISKQRNNTQTDQQIIENITIRNHLITETVIAEEAKLQNRGLRIQQARKKAATQRAFKGIKKQHDSMQINIDKINEISNSRSSHEKMHNLKGQNEGEFARSVLKRGHSPNSPLMTPMGQSLHTPLSQVSAFTEGTKSKGLSERKVFKRKPINGR